MLIDDADARSTKAGVETPATPGPVGRAGSPRRRSTKAGVETPATPDNGGTARQNRSVAQRRPELKPRLHVTQCSESLAARGALNEGRS